MEGSKQGGNIFNSGTKGILFSPIAIRYPRSMTIKPESFDDDLLITFKPEATPEEEERFLTELAHAIIAIARHIVAAQNEESDEGIEF
jgi:hypothetical protein